jgi:hypothetical protein
LPKGIYQRSPDLGAKISAALMGHETSDEHRRRIGDAHRGRPKPKCLPECTCGKHRGAQGLTRTNGYLVRTGVVHPLAGKPPGISGNVYEHRLVLWEKLGCQSLDCEHECEWCGRVLNWATIKADHVDRDKANNDPENLVPSCNGCNIKRGYS